MNHTPLPAGIFHFSLRALTTDLGHFREARTPDDAVIVQAITADLGSFLARPDGGSLAILTDTLAAYARRIATEAEREARMEAALESLATEPARVTFRTDPA